MVTVMDEVVEVQGVRLIAENDMVVRAHQDRSAGFEPETLRRWRTLARASNRGTLVDVGCYTGIYAIAAAQEGAKIVAFEPNPVAAARARRNFVLNGVSVDLWENALWIRDQTLTLTGRTPMTSAGSVVSDQGPVTMTVAAARMDSFGLTNVTAVKIDAERAEPQVLGGAAEIIARDRPEFLIEALDNPDPVAGILGSLGYRGEPCGPAMVRWSIGGGGDRAI